MAFNLENMSVNYKSLLNVVPTQRTQLASSGALDELISALTPGQLVNLFPRYYREQLPDVGQINQLGPSLGSALSGGTTYRPSVEGTAQPYTPGPQVKKTMTPEDKAVQEIFQKAFPGQVGFGETSALTDAKGKVISTASVDMSPQERALLDTIAYGESPDYNTIAGGSKFEGFADHPRVFGSLGTTAAGRYQFVKGTWDGVVKEYNRMNPDNPITDFSPQNQDRAALHLAQRDYKSRTGRDLKADLDSPPANFGELLRYGLGGSGNNTTWQAFQKMTEKDIQSLFESNYEKNIGYVKDMESAAEQVLTKFDPSMIGQLDKRLQTWYENASEIQKKKFEGAIEKLGVDLFNETMQKQPVTTATLAAAASLEPGESRVTESQEGANRKLALKPELRNALEYAAEKSGIYIDTFSGGQTDEIRQNMGKRTTRHSVDIEGIPGAADIIAYIKDKNDKFIPLDVTNPQHAPYIESFTENVSRVIPDAGIGVNYMETAGRVDPTKMHVGGANKPGDPPAVWGNMPDYVREAHARGVAARAEDQKRGVDVLKEWQIEKKRKLEEAIKADAEARAQADPGAAVQNRMEIETGGPVPSFKDGGQFDVPPGENITGIDDAGNVKFYARETESIKIDPSGLENVQPIPDSQTYKEEPKKLEQSAAMSNIPQPVPQYMDNPQMFQDTVDGYAAVPPSQIRAANRAKLYGETSTGLVNGHFA